MPPETQTPMSTSPSTPTPHEDVIHNIGYRHYDGPRLGRGYARVSLFSQSLRGAYGLGRSAKSKVLPMLLFAAMCAPALIIVAVAISTKMTKLPMQYMQYTIYLQMVIALFVAAQAPQSVSRDLRFKTTPLYFSRPIERIDYVAAKYAAMTAALFVLIAAPLVILYAGGLLAKFGFTSQTAGFGKGIVAALLLSLLLAGIGMVIAAITPRRGFGVAAIIAVLAVSYGAVTAIQGIAYSQENFAAEGWFGLFSPISLLDGAQSWWLGATISNPGNYGPPNAFAGIVYLLALLAVIAGCFGLLMRRYRKVGLS